jgi:hypothetical protein
MPNLSRASRHLDPRPGGRAITAARSPSTASWSTVDDDLNHEDELNFKQTLAALHSLIGHTVDIEPVVGGEPVAYFSGPLLEGEDIGPDLAAYPEMGDPPLDEVGEVFAFDCGNGSGFSLRGQEADALTSAAVDVGWRVSARILVGDVAGGRGP